jgi:cytochrome c biogenesis DsbD-like protein
MRTSTIGVVLGLALLAACKRDAKVVSENPVSWSVSSVSGLLQPNSIDTVHFAAVLDSGWYIYSLTQKTGGPTPMTVTIAPSPPFALVGNVVGPQPVVIFDKEFGIDTERYTGAPAFAAAVSVASGKTRSSSVDVKVRYQACNATLCLPARTTTLTTPVRIANP